MIIKFKVVTVSSNANSFGLHGHVLMAEDGTAYQVGRNRGPSNDPQWNKGDTISITADENGNPFWANYSVEIPEKLKTAPEKVVREVWGSYQKPAPKQRVASVMAKCSDACSVVLLEDGVKVGEYDGYVPQFLNPLDGDEDYIGMRIDLATGQILNWKKPTQAELKKIFKA